jgi:hypothetical protein
VSVLRLEKINVLPRMQGEGVEQLYAGFSFKGWVGFEPR